MKTNKSIRPLIASSLAVALGVSVASGAALPTQCLNSNNYACFKYGNSNALTDPSSSQVTSWETFSQGTGNNKFTSKSDLSGQFVKKDAQDAQKFLGIGLNNSSLILNSLSKTQITEGLHDKNPIMLYVDVTKRTSDQNILQLQTKDSVFVGNIQIKDIELEKNPNGGSVGSTNPVATLIFEGNKAIDSSTDLKFLKNETGSTVANDKNVTGIVRDPESNGSYALVGGLFNASGRVVNVSFNDGAKMFGDFYTTSSGNSKTVATFDGASGGSTTVFDGGIQAKSGANSLTFKEGNVNAVSATFGSYGIWAEDNGNNVLMFGDGKNASTNAQTLTTSGVVAKSTSSDTSSTSNIIIFQNQQTSNNSLTVNGTIQATSGENTFITLKSDTALNITIDEAAQTLKNQNASFADYNIKNQFIINGNLSIGEKGMRTFSQSKTIGINTRVGKTIIALKDTTSTNDANGINSTIGLDYKTAHSLTTSRIYASPDTAKGATSAENIVNVEGDITLLYVKGYGNQSVRDSIIGGDILAANGGKNTIVLNGVFKVKGYEPKTTPPAPSNGEVNQEISANGTTVNANTMFINAYGSANSKNDITVKNTADSSGAVGNGTQDITIGSVSATGGTNFLSLYAGLDTDKNNKKVTISSLLATNTKTDGTQDVGGNNEIYIKNGTVEINNIITQSGGSNTIAITRSNYASGQLNFVEYGVGGNNTIYFGKDNSSSDISVAGKKIDGVKITLNNNGAKRNLALKFNIKGDTALDLTIGDGSTSSYFDGSIDSTAIPLANTKVDYTVKKDSVFLVNPIVTQKENVTSNISLEDGAKFIFNGNGNLGVQTLTLSQSTNADTDYSKATDALSSTVVDLATNGIADVTKVAETRKNTNTRTLTVQTLTASGATTADDKNPLFRLYTKGVGQTDNVTIATKVATATHLNVQVFLDASLLNHDFGADSTKTIIFTNKGGTDSALDLGGKTKTATTGFTSYSLAITKETDSGDTVWRLGGVQDKQVNTEAVEYTTSAMGINYGIFVQNINSLNKRMGELRNNDNTQGVWARIFGGQSTNTMDLIPAKSSYVTIQGGYDYGFGVSGGTNYVGVALSYGYTSSETDRSTNSIASITGYSSKSNNIELGIYNSYIQDEGWFSDTIAKFSYIMSDFDIYEQNNTQTQSLNNFALSLGQEVGYRFALGSEKNWFIDPQVELVAGYINSTDLSQVQAGQVLDGKLDSVFLFRTRVGSDFGYSLKKDKNQYDFRMGLSYEYDVANADAFFDIASANMSKVFNNAVDNDGRVVLNLGTNMKFGENVRVYFDFEKSFAGKITTDYQLNLGARYSFGEKIARVEEVKTQEKAPLKIENTQEQPQTPNQSQN